MRNRKSLDEIPDPAQTVASGSTTTCGPTAMLPPLLLDTSRNPFFPHLFIKINGHFIIYFYVRENAHKRAISSSSGAEWTSSDK